MPRTFLVRRTALQLNTPSSAESEEDCEIKYSEPSVNQNTDLNINEECNTIRRKLHLLTGPNTETEITENSDKINPHSTIDEDQSPTCLSRAVSKSIEVDSVTGTINNNTLYLECLVKEEPVDSELDAEVAYHTDKSFSSQTSDNIPFSRPASLSSIDSVDSQTHQSGIIYSDVSQISFQDLEKARNTSLSLPLITPHQPLPPFASLAYNVFITSRKETCETVKETVTMETGPATIIKLPLRFPLNDDQSNIQYSTESRDKNNDISSQSEQVQNETVSLSKIIVNEKDDVKTGNEQKQSSEVCNNTNTTKSAPRIWNPFHHVSTPKSKVLPVSSVMTTPVSKVNTIQSHDLNRSILNDATAFMRNSCVPAPTLVSSQLRIVDISTPDTEVSCYNMSSVRHSPYFSEINSSFQTVPQINASQNFHPGFSPRIQSPFLPHPSYYRPDMYIRSQTSTPARTSTPVMSPLPSTPVIRKIERPVSAGGHKLPCSTIMETPKKIRIDNMPFQIYSENPATNVESNIRKLPHNCPVTPILGNKSGLNQENIPLNLNRTPLSIVQTRATIQQPRSPVVLGPSSISKENIPHHDTKEPVLTVLNNQHTPQKIEVINGGYGIKNPSFIPPKPADITNIQHDNTGKGRFACKVCGKEFAIQRLLNRHLKCHSEAKRYLCTFCGKGFNDTFDLKRHTRIHTGVKPYKCNHCEKAFTQRCSLESHCRKVHNLELNFGYKQRRNKTYVCEDCGHSTTDPEVHFNHLKERHPNCPALAKPHDKRHFKFQDSDRQSSVPLRPRN